MATQFINIPDTKLSLTGLKTYNFYSNIQYGNGNKEVFDVFKPNLIIGNAPVVCMFHGGGFVLKDKDDSYIDVEDLALIEELVDNGIIVVNFNYDLLEAYVEVQGVLSCLESAKLGVQFLSYHSDFFKADMTKVVYRGGSSGAGIALWLGYQNDYGIPLDTNLIKREEITALAVSANIPQATYDIVKWDEEVFLSLGYSSKDDYDNNPDRRPELHRLYAITDYGDIRDNDAYRLSVDILNLIENKDPVDTRIDSFNTFYDEVVDYTITDINHSPYHGELLRTYLLAEGLEVRSNINGISGDNTLGESEIDYILRKL